MKGQQRFFGLNRSSVKQLVIVFLSLLAGVLGVYQARQHIEAKISLFTDKPVFEQVMTQVVVPARALSSGEIVAADDLSLRNIPEQYADSNSVTVEQYPIALGQRIEFDIDEGRPLLWAHLSGGVAPTFSGNLSNGSRAMTVRVDEINSLSGFLQPGDKIDLLFSHGLGESQTVVPVIQQLQIIATGAQTRVDKMGDRQERHFSTITVKVSPADAQTLTLAQQVGKLTAVLRNPEDVENTIGKPLSLTELLSRSEHKGLPVVAVKESSNSIVTNSSRAVIEYIVGGK